MSPSFLNPLRSWLSPLTKMGTLTALVAATTSSATTPVLDQANEPYSLYSVQLYTGAVPGGQTFTVGKAGQLSKVSVYVQKQCLPGCPDMLVQIRSLAGQVLSSSTVSQSLIPTGSYNWIDATFSSPINVLPGQQYALVVQNAQPNVSGGYDWKYETDSSVDSYPGGMLFQVGYSSYPSYDLYFRTYSSPTPVHQWKFNEGSGTATLDSAGAETGTLAGSAGWTSGPFGTSAVSLNPSSSYDPSAYVEFNAAVGAFGTGAFTVSHWFKSSFNLSGYLGDVIGNRQDSSNGNFFGVRLAGSGYLYVELDQDGNGTNYVGLSSAPWTVNDGQWHHLAYTRQGATVTLYLDGTAIASGSTSSGQATNLTGAYPFRAGRSLGNCCGNFLSLPTAVDDLRIYPTALSASDILELYQTETP